MNTDIFWRLVWKEYRQQQALWIAIALGGLIFQSTVLIYCLLNGVPDLANRLFTVALSIPVLYSLGCGAALFAGEHEAETFPFQQSLPVSAGRVFFAKFTFAIVSGLLLFPVLWLLAFAMSSWQLPDPLWHLQLWGGGVVTAIEVLIWSVLGSLILKRVLPAALAGGVTAALLGCGSLSLVVAFQDLYDHRLNEYVSTLPLRACCALVALAIAAKLGQQWFDERPIRWAVPAMRRARSNAATQLPTAPATWTTMLTRLMWHEWRQGGRTTMLCGTIGYVLLGGWAALSASDGEHAYLAMLTLVAAIFGANAFAADQRREQYRFFTEHGVRPRLVWFSRQLVWGAPLTMLALFAWGVYLAARHTPAREITGWNTPEVYCGFAVLVFAVGQLCSILIRSGIVAVFVAVLCSFMIGFWTSLMAGLGVPWWLFALPLPFIFFGASYLYAPKWIQERQTWRARAITIATIIVPLVSMVAAIAVFRVYEIPAIKPSFDTALVPDNDSPAARETARMYAEAGRLLQPKFTFAEDGTAVIKSRDEEWQAGIDLFLAASRRETCRFPSWDDTERGPTPDVRHPMLAVLAEAKALTEAGEFNEAETLYKGLLNLAAHYYQQDSSREDYISSGMTVEGALFAELPNWANHKSQSPENILNFLKHLQSWYEQHRPNWRRVEVARADLVQRVLALDDVALQNYSDFDGASLFGIKTIGILLPWERARMSRLLNIITEANLQGIEQLRARSPQFEPYMQRDFIWDVTLTLQNGERRLLRSTDVTAWTMKGAWWLPGVDIAHIYVSMEQTQQAARSAVQTQMALIAWRKQHEQLPALLDKLIGHPFDALPLDPFTDQPFVYYPEGIVEEIWDDPDGMMMSGGSGTMGAEMFGGGGTVGGDDVVSESEPPEPRLVRSEPFLWSPNLQIRYAPATTRGSHASPQPGDFRTKAGITLSETDLLHEGVRYPIPRDPNMPSDTEQPAASDD